MPTQLRLPVQPAGAEDINDVVAVLRRDDHVAYFASGVSLFTHREGDAAGRRIAAVQMLELGLARQDELSVALGVNRTTLYRQRRKLTRAGVLGVVDQKRGPQGPHRFTADKRQRVGQLLAAGASIRQAARDVGVTEGTVRHALRRGEVRPGPGPRSASALVGPGARSERDARAEGGVAVQRHTERALARMGQLAEAAPHFVASEAVRYGGALLALPALLTQGLLDAGEQAYSALKNGFYGLRATLLVLAFMALLRIRAPDQLQGHPPGELGMLLGLDRAPEVKTLRRKLWELATRQQATTFSRQLAERWVRESADTVGLLYVDGHVRPYHGPTILGGMALYPLAKAKEVLRFYREYSGKATPDELTIYAGFLTPPGGETVIALICCYCGPLDKGEEVIRPVRSLGPPLQDMLGPMPYAAQQCLTDAALPGGSYYYAKGGFLADLTDQIIDVFTEYVATKPSPLSAVLVQTVCGAASRVSSEATAFPHRRFPYAPVIVSQWLDAVKSEENVAWARNFWKALQPFAGAGVYVNDLGQDDEDRVRIAYGANYDRLAELKKRYDPDNVFRLNPNIKPAG